MRCALSPSQHTAFATMWDGDHAHMPYYEATVIHSTSPVRAPAGFPSPATVRAASGGIKTSGRSSATPAKAGHTAPPRKGR
jgi:hypothetical protein